MRIKIMKMLANQTMQAKDIAAELNEYLTVTYRELRKLVSGDIVSKSGTFYHLTKFGKDLINKE